MAVTKDTIATDSATELNQHIGNDATATFENDPTFIESNPTGTASSENVEIQRSTEDSDDSDDELDDETSDEDESDEEDKDGDEEDIDEEDEDSDVEEEAAGNLQRV
jgi:hypothetical protein